MPFLLSLAGPVVTMSRFRRLPSNLFNAVKKGLKVNLSLGMSEIITSFELKSESLVLNSFRSNIFLIKCSSKILLSW